MKTNKIFVYTVVNRPNNEYDINIQRASDISKVGKGYNPHIIVEIIDEISVEKLLQLSKNSLSVRRELAYPSNRAKILLKYERYAYAKYWNYIKSNNISPSEFYRGLK